jgi:hypothetical protein
MAALGTSMFSIIAPVVAGILMLLLIGWLVAKAVSRKQ